MLKMSWPIAFPPTAWDNAALRFLGTARQETIVKKGRFTGPFFFVHIPIVHVGFRVFFAWSDESIFSPGSTLAPCPAFGYNGRVVS